MNSFAENPFFLMSLCSQRPAARDHTLSQPVRKPLLGRECNQTLRDLSSSTFLPSVLVQVTHETLRKGKTKRVGQRLRQLNRCIAILQSLVGIAESPQDQGHVG